MGVTRTWGGRCAETHTCASSLFEGIYSDLPTTSSKGHVGSSLGSLGREHGCGADTTPLSDAAGDHFWPHGKQWLEAAEVSAAAFQL